MPKKAEDRTEVPKTYLECRAFRHQTVFRNDHVTRGTNGQVVEFVRVTRCVHCKTEVHTTYSVPDFRVVKRKYHYPDNYGVKGGYPVHDARSDFILNRFA